MPERETIVTAFIVEFDAEHPDVQTLLAYFSDDGVYHNMPPLGGKIRD